MVDPIERRRVIIDALFDVVIEAGIEQVSLRRVAEAAGLVVGSVRHYFASYDELLGDAAVEIVERISERLARHVPRLEEADDRLDVAVDMLSELVPMDRPRAREVTVWLEIAVAARVDTRLTETASRLLAGSRQLATVIFERSGAIPAETIPLEAERLAALVDGLALRATLHGLPAATVRDVLRHHLHRVRAGG